MKIIICFIVSFSFSAYSDDSSVYSYRVDLKAHYPKNLDGQFPSKTTAQFVKDNNLMNDCIDVHSLGSASTLGQGYTQFNDTVGLLTNQPLTLKQQDILKASLCKGSDGDCKVTITFKSEHIDGLSIYATPREWPRYNPAHSKIAKIGARKSLPKFSDGCSNGDISSELDVVNTKDSKDLLKNVGIDLSKANEISLTAQDEPEGDRFWNFGEVKHDRGEKPSSDPVNQKTNPTRIQ